jgi:hypothetical protein
MSRRDFLKSFIPLILLLMLNEEEMDFREGEELAG